MTADTRKKRRSNSQRQNEAAPSQELAKRLIALAPALRTELEMPEHVRDALEEHAKIKSHNARRRQERHLAALIRNEECDELVAALDAIDGERMSEAQLFQKVERWRADILATEGAELQISTSLKLDSTHHKELLTLTAKARSEREVGRPRGAGKALFKFLRRFA